MESLLVRQEESSGFDDEEVILVVDVLEVEVFEALEVFLETIEYFGGS